MTSAQKNLAASSILLLLFGGASAHLARENTALQARSAAPPERSGELTVSSTRSRRSRERTVGDLFHEYAAPKSAHQLLLEWSLTRNQVGHGKWKLAVFYFSQLSLSELLELQAELLTTGGPRWELRGLLKTLQARLHQRLKDEPALFFDHAIGTSDVYGTTQHYFGKWIKEDPGAAVAWFRSKDPGKDFDAGKFESRQSRDILRSVLLETLAETDLETALALVREENARGKSYPIPHGLQSKLIEQAATNGEDSALLDLLRSDPDSHLLSSRWANDPESFWVRFTGATGDLDRSVTLLQSLEKPDGYGEAMVAIISTQAELPLPQQVDWLHDQIPDRESRDQSVSHLFLDQDSFDPFSDNRNGLSPQTREWLNRQARSQENDPFLSSTATALSNTGIHLAAYELASRLTRSQANESLVREFASRLYQADEAAAARVLPPELLEQISPRQE